MSCKGCTGVPLPNDLCNRLWLCCKTEACFLRVQGFEFVQREQKVWLGRTVLSHDAEVTWIFQPYTVGCLAGHLLGIWECSVVQEMVPTQTARAHLLFQNALPLCLNHDWNTCIKKHSGEKYGQSSLQVKCLKICFLGRRKPASS